MDESIKDKVKGTIDEAVGKVKEKIGEKTNDPDMQDEGTLQKWKGKAQDKLGDIEKVFEQ